GLRLYRERLTPAERWLLMALLLMVIIIAPNYLYFIRLKYLLGFALAGIAVFHETARQGDKRTMVSEETEASR
ncbi:MAG: hypothetical protein KFF77_02235, partial [Bacteroidetes bacterium]|nr:hypothetical protein [Bacteroidota bacterium]